MKMVASAVVTRWELDYSWHGKVTVQLWKHFNVIVYHYGKPSQNCTIRGPTCPPKIRNVQASCTVDSKVHFNFLLMPNYHTSGLFQKPILYHKEVYCTLLHLQIPSPSTLVLPSMRQIAAVSPFGHVAGMVRKLQCHPLRVQSFP